MSPASATPPVPSEGATPSSQQYPCPERAATPGPCGRLPRSKPGCSSLRSRRVIGSRVEAGESGPSPEPRPPKPAVRAARTEVGATGARGKSALRQPAQPRWGPRGVARCPPSRPGSGLTGPATSETLSAARSEPHTHQDPLEERVLLGREAHGRHGSGSSRGSRHRPARSVRLSARRHCRSRAHFSLESSTLPPLGLRCRRAALS